ncbi:hypothetical protein KR026_002729, partial [Drosophila bipectinata]
RKPNSKKVFSTSNEALTFNTSVIATIRTKSDEPVYSRLYPYPMGAADFVNNEIKELLSNGIIRPSRSPYNSPAWVVDKKGTDDNGIRKKRLVIDFRKLNEQTIADRYPMPSIPMILANLGKAKYFTTQDLRSGYHQIYLAEKDREKTSNQIILEEANQTLRRDFIVFGNRTRHVIHFNNKTLLVESVKEIINANVVNAIHCDFPTLACIKHALRLEFPATKFWHC